MDPWLEINAGVNGSYLEGFPGNGWLKSCKVSFSGKSINKLQQDQCVVSYCETSQNNKNNDNDIYIWIIHLYSAVINITRFRDRINISDANSEHWQLVLLWDFKNGKKEKSFHDLKFQGWPCICIADWSVSCSFVSLLYNKKYLWLTLTQTFSQSCPLVLATLCQLNIKIPLTVSVKYLVRITIVYVKYLILFQGPHLWYFNFNYKKVKGTFTLHKLFKWIQFEHFQWRACIE